MSVGITLRPECGFVRVCSGKGGVEALQHSHDVLALAYRPDGKLLASATLDGQIYLWDPQEAQLLVGLPTMLLCHHKLITVLMFVGVGLCCGREMCRGGGGGGKWAGKRQRKT